MTSTEQFLSRSDGLYGGSSTHAQDSEKTTMISMAMQTKFPSWNIMQKTKRKKSNHRRHQTSKNTTHGERDARQPNDGDTSKTQKIQTAMKSETKFFFHEDDNNNNIVNSSSYESNSSVSDDISKKEKPHQVNDQSPWMSPSRYKGKRRGTYVAEYDPRATLNQRRLNARSKSLFIRADESGASDLRIQMLLKTFHLNQDGGGESSLTASSDDELCKESPPPSQRSSKETELTYKDSPSLSQKSGTARRCHRHHCNNNKQKRAHSTFNNLSKEHVKYLEQKYENSQARALAGSFDSDDGDTSSWPLHEACKQGDLEKLKLLVDEEGCDIKSIDSKGHTPCYYAILNGHFECVSFLVSKGADLHAYFKEQKVRYFRC